MAPDLPSRGEAIRRLVESALARAERKALPRKPVDPAVRAAASAYAEKVANRQIDRALEVTHHSDDEKADRKRRLTKMPGSQKKP
jgi:hypothetical protein